MGRAVRVEGRFLDDVDDDSACVDVLACATATFGLGLCVLVGCAVGSVVVVRVGVWGAATLILAPRTVITVPGRWNREILAAEVWVVLEARSLIWPSGLVLVVLLGLRKMEILAVEVLVVLDASTMAWILRVCMLALLAVEEGVVGLARAAVEGGAEFITTGWTLRVLVGPGIGDVLEGDSDAAAATAAPIATTI